MSPGERLADERGVFVPGLMGAGILLSIVMLVSDGVKKMFPVRGDRARAARVRVVAQGRARDLLAVGTGTPPRAARVHHVPRPAPGSLLLAALASLIATGLVAATLAIYNSKTGLLSNRGWTLGAGYTMAGVFVLAALIWLASAATGTGRPRWLERLASLPPLGGLPAVEPPDDPLTAPLEIEEEPST